MTAVPKWILDLVWERDDSRCFKCTTGLIRGQGGYSVHHRRARGMGGSRDPVSSSPANLLLLCGSGNTGCHGWIESHRSWALINGFLLRQGQDPTEVPVERWMTQSITLDHDGDIRHSLWRGGVEIERASGDDHPRGPLRELPGTS